jgi:predicted GIY-YIG superfamily endonuclease
MSDDGLFIRYSIDLKKRLKQHWAGLSFATSCRGPWKLIYYEAYAEETDGRRRERHLKSAGGRRLLHMQLRCYFKSIQHAQPREQSFYAA